jgi:DNA invertase Pin-like site-specific DNA recombinase
MKLGIYCRVSTENQQDNTSIQSQIDDGIRFCEKNGYEYEIFSEIESGALVDRDALQQLYFKIKNKELDGICLFNYDRLSRDKRVEIAFEDIIRETGCKVYVNGIEKDIIHNESDYHDYAWRTFYSGIERRQIRTRVSNGKRIRLEKGEILVGMYGICYEKINGKIVIIEKEKKLIVDLYKTFLRKDCKTYSNLIKRLEGMYESKGGLDKRINSSSIKRLLSNVNFCGVKRVKNTYAGVVSYYDINIGEIVSKDLFDAVQNKLNIFKSNNNKRNKKGSYLLDNKVYCKGCNDKMWIRNVNGKKKNYLYYMCYTNSERNSRFGGVKKLKRIELGEDYGCSYLDGNVINLNILDEVVWEYLFKVLKNTKHLKNEYQKKYNTNKVLNSKQVGKLSYYKKKLLDYDKRIKIILNKFIDGELTKLEKDVLVGGIEENRLEMMKHVSELELEINNFSGIDSDVVLNYLEYLEIDLEREYSVNRFGDRYEFINKYIDKIGVEVYDGELNEGKRNKNYNIFINLKFELDEDDYDSILKIKNNMKQNYNLYVLENKISYSYTLMHKILLVLQITINLSIHSKNKVFSKITNIKIN